MTYKPKLKRIDKMFTPMLTDLGFHEIERDNRCIAYYLKEDGTDVNKKAVYFQFLLAVKDGLRVHLNPEPRFLQAFNPDFNRLVAESEKGIAWDCWICSDDASFETALSEIKILIDTYLPDWVAKPNEDPLKKMSIEELDNWLTDLIQKLEIQEAKEDRNKGDEKSVKTSRWFIQKIQAELEWRKSNGINE